jgi:hypothetical protein
MGTTILNVLRTFKVNTSIPIAKMHLGIKIGLVSSFAFFIANFSYFNHVFNQIPESKWLQYNQ